MPDISLEEAVERNCQALIAGNIAQIFVDMTPEAMAKLSQSAGAAQMGSGPMPKLTAYEIVDREQADGDDVYDVHFHGDVNFGVKARWRAINDQWKLVDFEPYQLDQPAESDQPAAGHG
jgi:hypothetical protein